MPGQNNTRKHALFAKPSKLKKLNTVFLEVRPSTETESLRMVRPWYSPPKGAVNWCVVHYCASRRRDCRDWYPSVSQAVNSHCIPDLKRKRESVLAPALSSALRLGRPNVWLNLQPAVRWGVRLKLRLGTGLASGTHLIVKQHANHDSAELLSIPRG